MNEKAMTIIDYLDFLIKSAMKQGDKDMLAIYRIAKSDMIKQQKEKGVVATLIETEPVYKSMKKRLLEEIDGLEKAGRDTTVQKKHLDWVVSQLPAPVSEEDIRNCIKEYLLDHDVVNLGGIMGRLKVFFAGKTVDMSLASKIAKEMMENK